MPPIWVEYSMGALFLFPVPQICRTERFIQHTRVRRLLSSSGAVKPWDWRVAVPLAFSLGLILYPYFSFSKKHPPHWFVVMTGRRWYMLNSDMLLAKIRCLIHDIICFYYFHAHTIGCPILFSFHVVLWKTETVLLCGNNVDLRRTRVLVQMHGAQASPPAF